MMKIITSALASTDIPLGSEVGGVGPFQTAISGGVQSGLGTFLSNLVTTITVVGSIAFVIYFFIGALKWITAGGDKGKVSEAQAQMTQAAIGLIAIVASFFIIGIVGAVLGLDILNPFNALKL
ncbi:TPA: hypothetical protein DIU27_04915 [Candidatus Collierbacteria bacterium]|uniref:Uncharacterized protein n=1 Tax=Candidatus Collierbacteria bacterium GW2011_GWB2_44_22 TaxID=1618387 RepID=A0A0G1HW25_9BACT|nr:MAG: hypothetical protein UW31_C0006G0025 [Candidatus Collierbacteria bacterium GW2011_GWA2_44_13]KKT51274.1 MAG: hypothetical protein UW42_C0004G0029 [Candidatus Collierbacteria bacterium GW2011_GWB1_44_197]KKT51306.1 MAG: hypothetical protein UW44_C0013G0026 [Candidatus Collierbacteria bacterium GW2011_GWB2_44_22]KKT61846.1 MAG: hypothetical protein UW56_C0017G0029 [Candidatus Collierbacteria bacterium GW2011_GWD1_44_27]KKT66570.1 MAG: hypothetical protein UW58_C0006G0033 [Candidatus Colli